MHEITLLDVTLRDGGYQNNFQFEPEQLQHILQLLDESNIDYIEIGYRNGSARQIANIGAPGLCKKDYLNFCRKIIQKAKIAVMVHPKNVTQADLEELKACGVDLIRVCVVKNGLDKAIPTIEACEALGIEISVNLTHLSRYTDAQLAEQVIVLSKLPVDMIYFADSNGSMMPPTVQRIYKQFTASTSIAFGFHAHDNLGLAQANSITAMNAGATFIDVSLSGLGKGIGNLKAEFFIAYLHALKNQKYSIDAIRKAGNFVQNQMGTKFKSITLNDFMMGISDLSMDDILNQSLGS